MKRKYDNPKVKVGDWVYFLEDEKYVGEFKNDKLEGEGVYYLDEDLQYEGKWENGIEVN